MSQNLPLDGFEWVKNVSQFTEEKIKSLRNEHEEGRGKWAQRNGIRILLDIIK